MTKIATMGRLPRLSLLVLFLALPRTSQADVRLPAIFGDHMVLQQDGKIPVWGWADPGEAVAVTLGDDSAKATADAGGKWSVALAPVKTTATPLTLTVAGKNTVTFSDVLVGDVWICSGQSNMAFGLAGAHDAATTIPAAKDPQLRFFRVMAKVALDPETDVAGKWEVCTPDSAKGFSAVGYYFGQELRRALNRPIGLIGTYWGGTAAQAWTSLDGLQKAPPFDSYVKNHDSVVANYPKAKDAYTTLFAAYQADLKKWNETVLPAYIAASKAWVDAARQAKTAGQPLPPKPSASAPIPRPPIGPEGGPGTPSVLYNGMIVPLIPYGIKGTIWYQGESNASNALEYRTLFPRMISDWREKWGEGDFPFIFVQIGDNMAEQPQPAESGWALLREAQLMTLSQPNTGMAVMVDIGGGNLHPPDKHDVGLRLALAAKHLAYGQDIVYSGPLYDSMKVEGNKIRLSFKDIGTGLKMGTPPWTPPTVAPTAPTELAGFAITGADKHWVWAKAEIDGKDVVVSSDQVATPVAVRYGWSNNPTCNLYNNEGLPASPFRTDAWIEPPPVRPSVTPPVVPAPAPAPVPKT